MPAVLLPVVLSLGFAALSLLTRALFPLRLRRLGDLGRRVGIRRFLLWFTASRLPFPAWLFVFTLRKARLGTR